MEEGKSWAYHQQQLQQLMIRQQQRQQQRQSALFAQQNQAKGGHTNNNNNPNTNFLNFLNEQQPHQQQQMGMVGNARGPPGGMMTMQQRRQPGEEVQMAYQDLWRVCHPDYTTPFSSLEDACHRLLPYHVVADYEEEEDDRILQSDTTGQMLSRSQQWDRGLAAKIQEFATTFEKQVLAFNLISQKRASGEFRSEEKLMIEQALLQEERLAVYNLKVEMESIQKAIREAREANLRMTAMVQAEQAPAQTMARGPIRLNALGAQGGGFLPTAHEMDDQEVLVNPEDIIDGWGNNAQPCDDFLNDEEPENGGADVGEFDLNTR